MGGTDDPSNLIELTVEEHAEAHRLLYEEYGKQEDYIAWKALSGSISSEEARILAVKSALTGKKQTPEHLTKRSNLGKKFGPASEERKKKISEALKGKPNPNKKGKPRSDETRKKISNSRMGIEPFSKGKIYIHNGIICKVISKTDPIPEGWVKGRIMGQKPEQSSQKE